MTESHVPSRTEQQEKEEVGLAVLKPDSGIEFGESWDFTQVENVLRENLPLLFRYLDGLMAVCADESDATSTIEVGRLLPPWVLCTRSRATLKGLSRVPDGSLFNFNKGTNKSGWRQCTIFIATRQAIPESIYRKWGKANVNAAELSGSSALVGSVGKGPTVQVSTGKRHRFPEEDSNPDEDAAASDSDSIASINYLETEKITPTRSSSRLRSKKFKRNPDILDLTADETPQGSPSPQPLSEGAPEATSSSHDDPVTPLFQQHTPSPQPDDSGFSFFDIPSTPPPSESTLIVDSDYSGASLRRSHENPWVEGRQRVFKF
ncbi:hypothetical protein BV22DRAFT_1050852 [Leucogyrophana mollusca]|uniref:Uncharacterized protein n=1 Tax=Leucogyrophana mollusca TaxID=85980 RepID=A0ACB8B247_9AGAM|nr:hypothetical protein BV22DRAFT_1050852 [Leucogyrophana mollusca]